jgi:hypothetical protein
MYSSYNTHSPTPAIDAARSSDAVVYAPTAVNPFLVKQGNLQGPKDRVAGKHCCQETRLDFFDVMMARLEAFEDGKKKSDERIQGLEKRIKDLEACEVRSHKLIEDLEDDKNDLVQAHDFSIDLVVTLQKRVCVLESEIVFLC